MTSDRLRIRLPLYADRSNFIVKLVCPKIQRKIKFSIAKSRLRLSKRNALQVKCTMVWLFLPRFQYLSSFSCVGDLGQRSHQGNVDVTLLQWCL